MAPPFPLSSVFLLSVQQVCVFACRETKEGWPLLTVETEVWRLKEYKRKGSFRAWFVGLFMPVQEILVLSLLAALVGTTFFFLTVHYFDFYVPIAQQAGQAAMLGRLPLSMCLWLLAWTSGGNGRRREWPQIIRQQKRVLFFPTFVP
jgi:hypothetical protein